MIERVVDQAVRWEATGEFARAEAELGQVLAQGGLAEPERESVAFARDRFRRIRRDFRLTRAEVYAGLEAAIREVTPAEFERWIGEGLFDIRRIDGEERFFVSSVSNLFFRRPELGVRRRKPRADAAVQEAYWENAVAIREAARSGGSPYVLPKRFRVRMVVTLAEGSVASGEEVSAWLPVPRTSGYQGQFHLLSTSSPVVALEPERSVIRSVFLRQPASAGGGGVFTVEYEYTAHGVGFDLDPNRSRPHGGTISAELAPYVGESPQVRFTPAMRAWERELGGGETNEVRRARRFYEWIGSNIRYSYAPEYSTVRDLAEVCRSSRRGDCGQVALVFMTLCRLGGIPARWQSGWGIFPGDETIHDWCEIHLEPWGWVPVDPYMAMYAEQQALALSPRQRHELRDFYLGGMTQHRMSANADHQQELRPRKRSMRSDPVDFQRGELEAGGTNVYFDRFEYDLRWEEIRPEAGVGVGR